MFLDAGFPNGHSQLCCYNLIGFKGDTFSKAGEGGLIQTWDAGFMPYAMLYRDEKGESGSRMAKVPARVGQTADYSGKDERTVA